MPRCPECGAQADSDVTYCPECGAGPFEAPSETTSSADTSSQPNAGWGSAVVNLLKFFAVLTALVLAVVALPLVLAVVVGTNAWGVADKLTFAPGIDAGGGVKAGLVGGVYGLLLFGVAGFATGDTTVEPDVPPTATQEPATTSGGGAVATTSSTSPSPSTQTPTATPTARTTTARSSTSVTATAADRRGTVVTVVEVVDGDTLDIQFQNGTIDTVRLLGVDTPEVSGETSPDEFEGVPDTAAARQCLRNEGENASQFTRQQITGETIRLVFDNQSDRRGAFGRLLAYVYVNGTNLNYRLVSQGHARVYDSTFTQSGRFYQAEDRAQALLGGVWRCRNVATPTPTTTSTPSSEGELSVAEIHEDAEGNDNENLNDEYIVFENTGGSTLDLSGFTVSDTADHTYTVPSGTTLDPGEQLTLYTGSGTDTDSELYWGSGSAIWNNGGDTITVKDNTGEVVLERSYE